MIQLKPVARKLRETVDDSLEIRDTRPVSGGCINETAVVDTTEGPFFLKWHADPPDHMFEREAEGLEELRKPETGLAIPKPVAVEPADSHTPGFIAMEYIEPGTRAPDFDRRLGRGLARLHQYSVDQFGFYHDNYCGTTPQPNEWSNEWIEFYREKRLRFQLQLAVDNKKFTTSERETFERFLDRLPEFLATDPESPALIHGDLWSGNLHTDPEGGPGILDPAAYYAHREAELGMMELFGGISSDVYRAYNEVYPLQKGWRDRVELYSLYHVMNHYNLFGGHYKRQAMRTVRRWL